MVRSAVREEGTSQILQDLVGSDEDFEFFPKNIGMPLMNFKQRSEKSECVIGKEQQKTSRKT